MSHNQPKSAMTEVGRLALRNVGNSCWVNAAVQFFTQMDGILNKLPPQKQSDVVRMLITLCRTKFSPDPHMPIGREMLDTANKHLSVKFMMRQEDAHEYFMSMLDAVERTNQYNSKLVDHNLAIGWTHTVECHQCGHKSVREEKRHQICIMQPADSDRRFKISDFFVEALAPELMTGANKYRCEHCPNPDAHPDGVLVDATRQDAISRFPPYLVFQVVRFDLDRKLPWELQFHRQLTNTGGQPPNYDLDAIIVHHGRTRSSGHYTTYLRADGRWLHADDESSREVTEAEVLNPYNMKNVYMLLYVRTA